jgi:hypothetical protein
MALSEFERKRIEKAAQAFIERRRPPPHVRPKLDFGYRITGQSLELFEIRPRWDKPTEKREHPFAKATYVKTTGAWKLFWRRADLKWHGCTRTISQWTQLSGHRIRQLYKSYASPCRGRVTRHRGMSPYKLELILSSPQLRCEAAIFAGICRSVHVLPEERLDKVDRMLPSLERGELLCDAYEWFRCEVPETRLTLEHGLLLLNELLRGEAIALGTCVCGGVMLVDRFSLRRPACVFCSSDLEEDAKRSA